jgi:muramoyltetrapeptide carboxypeptidase
MISRMHRRGFLKTAGLASLATQLPAPRLAAADPAIVKPRHLRAGDTIGIVSPASATFQTVDLQVARESLEALGLKVAVGPHMLDRRGYLGGDDKARAADINAFYGDPSVAAIHAIRGGWGSARVLPYLDYDLIRRNPKILIGYSDITALHMAIQARSGVVTIHGPIALGRWDPWSIDYFKRVVFDAQPLTYLPKKDISDKNALAQTEYRVQTITPGTARGRLLGGNLTVLTTILGSPYVPDFENVILFTEDTHEEPYSIDRMLTQLKLAGILGKLKGFVFGGCAECTVSEGNYGALTLEEIFNDHIKPLGIPAWFGAMIGHQQPQWTLAEGIQVEIDSVAGTIATLESPLS